MKTMKSLLIALAAMTAMAGCNSIDPDNGETAEGSIALTRAQQDMMADINGFAYDVFGRLVKESPKEQIFISPLSLSLDLAMTAAGASGKTAEQMTEVLGFKGYSTQDVNEFYSVLVKGLKNVDSSSDFLSANSIWVSEEAPLRKDYVTTVESSYGAQIENVDFNDRSDLKRIDKWCSDNTKGKIDKISDCIDGNTVLALLNALYFKAKWKGDEFTESGTMPFHGDGGDVKAKMMRKTFKTLYCSNMTYEAVEIPYGNGSFVMDIVLPREGKSVSDAVDALSKERLESLSSARVFLRLPIFKSECTTDLGETLKAMGMKDAFTQSADFSLMSKKPLCISYVRQKTFVDVNTKGTEAAAVTVIGMKATSVAPDQIVEMIVDRPFVYLIRERSSGAVLFIGQKTR